LGGGIVIAAGLAFEFEDELRPRSRAMEEKLFLRVRVVTSFGGGSGSATVPEEWLELELGPEAVVTIFFESFTFSKVAAGG
jgi:hypothetical protein